MAYFKRCPVCNTLASFADDELPACPLGCYEVTDTYGETIVDDTALD